MRDARNQEPPVKIGVVGLGYWGPNIVRVLQELDCAEMAIVCDLDHDARTRITKRFPNVTATASFDELLADDSLEAVAIATPVGTHFRLACAALDAGKHVFIEKPLAASGSEATMLMEKARALRLTLMPGHTFLYSPPVNAVRQLIKTGALGEIFFISTSRVNLGLHQPDVSVVWDLAPHDFSILRYWLDDTPIRISAMARGCVIPEIPDVAFINLKYGSGIAAHAELSWLAPSKLRRTAVVGSERMVVYDDTSNEPVRIFDSGVTLPDPTSFGEYKLTYRTGDITSPRIDVAEPLSLELEDFCRAMRAGEEPRSNARLGVDVVEMIEAVDESLRNAGAPVSISRAVVGTS